MNSTYLIEGNGGGSCNGGFGAGWGLDGLLVGALLGGGFGGGLWGGRGGAGAVETASINDTIQNQTIESKVCDVLMAVSDVKNNDTFNAKDLMRANDQNTYNLKSSIDACCCNTQNAIQGQGYENRIANLQQTINLDQQFCKLNETIKCGFDGIETRRILDQRDALAAEVLTLKGQISQDRQTAIILGAIAAGSTTATA